MPSLQSITPRRLIRCTSLLGSSLFLFFSMQVALAITSRYYVIDATATIDPVTPSITLNWTTPVSTTLSTTIYRRVKVAGTYWSDTWGSAYATTSTGAISYTDKNVSPGVIYEYRLTASYNYTGYLVSGYNLPLVENRGNVILLIDDTMTTPLAPEIAQLEKNLIADGWKIYRHDVPREVIPSNSNSNVIWSGTTTAWDKRKAEQLAIRTIVQNDYATAPTSDWALFILGRVPVPYAGDMASDGHGEHMGAWPTDSYYADIDGVWTDTTVSNTAPNDSRNDNSIGDGKFDSYTLSSAVELQCGRVDLSNMPSVPVGMSETELLRQYLVRDSNFRQVRAPYDNVARRGIVCDGFSRIGSYYARVGWYTGVGFFGSKAGQMDEVKWFDFLPTTSVLLGYGNGSGTSTGAGGVGDSILDFGQKDSKAVFTMLFGSYFGDWDYPNDFLRAPLAGTANSLGLTDTWAGDGWNPIDMMPMATGATVGSCIRIRQGSGTDRLRGLMGDPTLRLHSVAPPTQVRAASATGGVTLTWQASVDPQVSGYHVYRSTTSSGPFVRITGTTATTSNPVGSPLSSTTTTYTDADPSLVAESAYYYLVKAVKMETSASGTYANQSTGEWASVKYHATTPTPAAPTRLTATRSSTTTCVLSWDDNASNEASYLIERRDPSTGTWTQINSVGANTTTYTDSTYPATLGKVIHYRVRASGSVNSDYSNEAADYRLPGIANGTYTGSFTHSYLVLNSTDSYSMPLTRFNGSLGDTTLTATLTGILGTADVDFPTTGNSVSWVSGDTTTKTLNLPLLQPSGLQLTKVLQATYSSTNGLLPGTLVKSPPLLLVSNPNTRALPKPWTTATAGAVTSGDLGGYAEYANGVFGIAEANAIGSTDVGRFIVTPVTGDFTFSARIAYNLNEKNGFAFSVGVVVCSDLSGTGVCDMLRINHYTQFQRSTRTTSGAVASVIARNAGTCRWLRMTRSGNTTRAYYSNEGVTWADTATVTQPATMSSLTTTAYVGLYFYSEAIQSRPIGYVRLDNVSLISADYPQVGTVSSLTANASGNPGDIALIWSAATAATQYDIERSTNATSGFVKIATATSPTVSMIDSGLTLGQTYYYRVRPYNDGNSTVYSMTSSSKPYLPSTMAGWTYTNYGTNAAIEGQTTDLAAPAGDGIANLMKYALGVKPCNASFVPIYSAATVLPVVQEQLIGSQQYLTCTFTHNKSAVDINYTILVADDPKGPWSALDLSQSGIVISVADNIPATGQETIVVRDTQPIASTSKRFMRFQVTR